MYNVHAHVPVYIIVAPQRRKQIQQYMLSAERLVHITDYSIPEPALAMVGYIPTSLHVSTIHVYTC